MNENRENTGNGASPGNRGDSGEGTNARFNAYARRGRPTKLTGEARDRDKIRRASRKVGFAVAGASALVLVFISLLVSAYVVRISRVETRGGRHKPGRHPEMWQERVVDVGDLVPVLVTVGIVAVIFLGVTAWFVSKQSTKPLEHALKVQRAFVADASHELRTPLTTLSSRIQLAKRRLEKGEDVAGALTAAQQDANALNEVLTDLLVAAESAGDEMSEGALANVDECVTQAVELVGQTAQTRGVEIVRAGAGARSGATNSVYAQASPTALTRALVILLDNAVAHSPDGGLVTVTCGLGGHRVQLRVQDEGSGIKDADRDRVFNRFTRADSGDKRGFGLGLALAKDVARRFRGDVVIESTSPAGTTFLLTLPEGKNPET